MLIRYTEKQKVMYSQNLKSLRGILTGLISSGYKSDFTILGDRLYSYNSQKYYLPNQVTLEKEYRFFGKSNTENQVMLFKVTCEGGEKGTVVTQSGATEDNKLHSYLQLVRRNHHSSNYTNSIKRILLTFSITLLGIVGIQAQGVSVGIKGGVNFADQKMASISTNTRTGFHGGIFASLMFSETLGLQPELLFSSQGSELDVNNFQDVKNEFDYITVPVLLKIKPASIFSLFIGPQIGFLTSAVRGSEDLEDLYRSNDFSAVFGAELELIERLIVGARYNLGLTDINKRDSEFDEIEIKNRMFQIYLGLKLLGKD